MGSEKSQYMKFSLERLKKRPGELRAGPSFTNDRLCECSNRLSIQLGRQVNARYESHNALIDGLRVESMAA